MIGEDRLIHFSGVQLGEACTIVLRGASAASIQSCCYPLFEYNPSFHTGHTSEAAPVQTLNPTTLVLLLSPVT